METEGHLTGLVRYMEYTEGCANGKAIVIYNLLNN